MTKNKSPIDQKALSKRMDGDTNFEKKMLAMVPKSCDGYLEKMKEAMHACDNKVWFNRAHDLRNMSELIGAIDLATLADYAIDHSEETAQQKQEILQKIKTELELVYSYISKRIKELQ